MDRKEYLIFCQKASVYNEIYVMYDNIKYFPYPPWKFYQYS